MIPSRSINSRCAVFGLCPLLLSVSDMFSVTSHFTELVRQKFVISKGYFLPYRHVDSYLQIKEDYLFK